MQSKAATVDDYLKELPSDRSEAMSKLRKLFLRELKGYEERMEYGGPCYAKNNVIEAGFASQKHFIGVYFLKQTVFKKYVDEFKNVTYGKGVIRFTKPDKIDFKVIQKMLKANFDTTDVICG